MLWHYRKIWWSHNMAKSTPRTNCNSISRCRYITLHMCVLFLPPFSWKGKPKRVLNGGLMPKSMNFFPKRIRRKWKFRHNFIMSMKLFFGDMLLLMSFMAISRSWLTPPSGKFGKYFAACVGIIIFKISFYHFKIYGFSIDVI